MKSTDNIPIEKFIRRQYAARKLPACLRNDISSDTPWLYPSAGSKSLVHRDAEAFTLGTAGAEMPDITISRIILCVQVELPYPWCMGSK